ncbi:MAG: LysM peptidoglycan-binding domain-containing protein [Streptosporangiaceae bacterium]
MNAMPAVARPGAPGIRPRHGASGSRPRGGGAEFRLVRDPRPGDALPAPGDAHRAPGGLLRLTRRGRVVAAAFAALLVTVISLLAAGVAQATNHAVAPGAARQHLVQVVVRPGQSLWSVAENADPDQDTRAVIQQIVDLNALSSDVVSVGQQLWVPRG